MTGDKKVHVVADGIREEDNHLPNWWLGTLFGAMVFAAAYWQYFQTFHVGLSPMEEYAIFKKEQAEMAAAAAAKAAGVTADQLLSMSRGAEAEQGAALFAANCVPCHGPGAEGKIGPNLTDSAWIHGSDPLEIRKSIDNGYPLKGMPAWGPVLGGVKVNLLASFVLTVKGRNLPGKAPEGVVPGAAPAAPAVPPAVAPTGAQKTP